VADEAREQMHEGDQGDGEATVAAPPRPSDDVAAAVLDAFAGSVFTLSHGQPVVYVDRSVWRDVVGFLLVEQEFTQVVDLTAVDQSQNPGRFIAAGVAPERFELVANCLSHWRNRRLRLITQVPESDPVVASLVPLFPGVELAEREVYDLMGVTFDGHPDLTRILLPDEWIGHPLRKDDAAARVPVQFKAAGKPQPRV
jgi:NADH-quinone oxidoreductase subunit C